jgi:hypothetical protein
MKKNEYQCATCKGIFKKGRPDEVAIKEFRLRHPVLPIEETAVVCDSCYKKMMRWLEELGEFVSLH